RGALHRRVDRCSLRSLAQRMVARLDLIQKQATPEHRFDKAALARLLSRVLHVTLHPGITLEIQIDVALRLSTRDAEAARETKGGHSVDQPEIDHLRRAPLIFR